jgi:hypothetical protein
MITGLLLLKIRLVLEKIINARSRRLGNISPDGNGKPGTLESSFS